MKFCMVVDLDNTYRGRMMMMMIMMLMMMMITMMVMMMMTDRGRRVQGARQRCPAMFQGPGENCRVQEHGRDDGDDEGEEDDDDDDNDDGDDDDY